jgi:hypothetical protein
MHDTADWRLLYRIGAMGAFITMVMIPIQIGFFVIWPPNYDVEAQFALFTADRFRGAIGLDALFIVDNVANIGLFVALGVALWRDNRSLALIAVVLSLVSSASYFSSNTIFEMADLSSKYAAATDPEIRSQLLAAGRFALATFQGTAFDIYYELGAAALLLLGWVMLEGRRFGRVTAWLAVVSGVLMIVLSLLSLPPFFVFLGTVGRQLWRLSLTPATA